MSSAAEIDDQLRRALSPFKAGFEHASERCTLTLYDEVADDLGSRFAELAAAAREQTDVLERVAQFLGIGPLRGECRPADPDREALAQRITWRSPARWAVLSLLWSLVQSRPRAFSPRDWAHAARQPIGKRPRGGSTLPAGDEPLALRAAADVMASSSTMDEGRCLFVLGVPVVISNANGSLATREVPPIALVQRRGDTSQRELSSGDEIWLADGAKLSVDGQHEERRAGVMTMTGPGEITSDPEICMGPVVRGVDLLFERDSGEHGR